MSELVTLMEKLDLPYGISYSFLEGVRFFRSADEYLERNPLLYTPALCIMLQGRKVAYFNDKVFSYDNENYLVTSVTIPFECETFAVDKKEILGVYIEIDPQLLYEVASQVNPNYSIQELNGSSILCGIAPAAMDSAMSSAVARLLYSLQDETEAAILGTAAIKEIYFRALQGSQAPMLHALINKDHKFAKVAEIVELIYREYANPLNIDELAKMAHMATSTFHRAFKGITGDTPIQYIKKIRLNKAKEFMLSEGAEAYMAASKVGYESASQFSREFKRYFGETPADLKRRSQAV